jgi:hypothetical protein
MKSNFVVAFSSSITLKGSIMEKHFHFLSILFAFAVFLGASLTVNAAETASAPAPAVQDSATLPPDSSPFTPDSPEKEKRVKELIKQITATYGFSRGREEFLPSWGPRIDKLYSLHKRLTDNDWKLLAEMYVSFIDSNWKILAGTPSNYNSKDASDLSDAMKILLAMRGESSFRTLSATMAALHWPSTLQQGNIYMIKDIIKFPPWNDLPEYKKDQRRENNLP